MHSTNISAQSYRLWLALAVAVPLGICLGGINTSVLLSFLSRSFPLDFAGIPNELAAMCWGGMTAGALQGAFLRPYPRPAPLWIGITGVGWVAAYALQRLFYIYLGNTSILPRPVEIGLGLGMGILIGLLQWGFLRRQMPRAHWWIVSNVLWWGIIWAGITLLAYALMGPAL